MFLLLPCVRIRIRILRIRIYRHHRRMRLISRSMRILRIRVRRRLRLLIRRRIRRVRHIISFRRPLILRIMVLSVFSIVFVVSSACSSSS